MLWYLLYIFAELFSGFSLPSLAMFLLQQKRTQQNLGLRGVWLACHCQNMMEMMLSDSQGQIMQILHLHLGF